MKFTVPQFIEREAKLIGPLTFNQFLYVGAAGLISFIIYFSFSFTVFIFSVIILGSTALAFAFLKVNGAPLAKFLVNFFKFNLSPKNYLWKKKGNVDQIQLKEDEEETDLTVGGKSHLKNKKTQIETELK
jgi:hypothetical protein